MAYAKPSAPALPWTQQQRGPSVLEAARQDATDVELVIHDDRLRAPTGNFPPAPGQEGFEAYWTEDARRTANRQQRRDAGSLGPTVVAYSNEGGYAPGFRAPAAPQGVPQFVQGGVKAPPPAIEVDGSTNAAPFRTPPGAAPPAGSATPKALQMKAPPPPSPAAQSRPPAPSFNFCMDLLPGTTHPGLPADYVRTKAELAQMTELCWTMEMSSKVFWSAHWHDWLGYCQLYDAVWVSYDNDQTKGRFVPLRAYNASYHELRELLYSPASRNDDLFYEIPEALWELMSSYNWKLHDEEFQKQADKDKQDQGQTSAPQQVPVAPAPSVPVQPAPQHWTQAPVDPLQAVDPWGPVDQAQVPIDVATAAQASWDSYNAAAKYSAQPGSKNLVYQPNSDGNSTGAASSWQQDWDQGSKDYQDGAKSKGVCFNFAKGRCQFGEACRYQHPEDVSKRYDWRAAPGTLPEYIMNIQKKSGSIFLIDRRDRRSVSPFNGLHPYSAWLDRDAETLRQNAQQAPSAPNDGTYVYLFASKFSDGFRHTLTLSMDYPTSHAWARNGEAVQQALKHEAFEGLECPTAYRGSGAFLRMRIWGRIGGPEYGDDENSWAPMLDVEWRGALGDRRLTHDVFRVDGFVANKVRPEQVGDNRKASNYRFQLLCLLPDQRVGTLSWDDQNPMAMLCDLQGRVVVARMGAPRMFFSRDSRAQGSEDFLAQDINRLEFSWQDGLNKTLFAANECVPEASCLLMTHVKGKVLDDMVATARSKPLGDVPRVLAPDQVLQSHQVAAVHDSWWPSTFQESNGPHRVVTVKGLMENENNFHHGTFSYLQVLPVTVTKDLRALGAQDTEALQVPYPCSTQGPLYNRILGPRITPPVMTERLAVAALTALPDPPPRKAHVPAQADAEVLPEATEQWLKQAAEDLAAVGSLPDDDEWAREAKYGEWGTPTWGQAPTWGPVERLQEDQQDKVREVVDGATPFEPQQEQVLEQPVFDEVLDYTVGAGSTASGLHACD